MAEYSVEGKVGERSLRIESGRLAGQAQGAVTVRYGDTIVLVTACVGAERQERIDFLPLTVDYEERLYAAGKIPGGFFRREGRPSSDAILVMRLTDRSIRPLFPKGYYKDIQVVITTLSADQENDPDVLAIVGASTALMLSGIPFGGPVSAVRVGYIDGQFVLNPTFSQLTDSLLDLVVTSTREAVVMVEAGVKEMPEDMVREALRFGQEANQEIMNLQEALVQQVNPVRDEFAPSQLDPDLEKDVEAEVQSRLSEDFPWSQRSQRDALIDGLRRELTERLAERYPTAEVVAAFETALKAHVRRRIFDKGLRSDGRGYTDIRPITCEVGALPRTHGSGLFTRGQTQVLSIATLGSVGEKQIIDGLTPEESKRFMHHYNFPPFSTGEVRRMGSTGRREIGHGALAERALAPVIPSEEDFPYTIRLVSEVLSSNGSTSMGSVCGSSLALMDAGVPIKSPVAGVAMGLTMDKNGRYAILTDIEGMEDALGDMDFKVAGTAQGITALQMDVKIKGISHEVLKEALERAREGRLYILEKMAETISASRPQLSRYAPRMIKISISPDKIRYVIGPGGKTIRSITEETKVTLDVEDDGTVIIGSTSEEAAQRAIKLIEGLTRDVEVGGIYTGRVTRITGFGAFVEILPGKEGLVHISELADYRVARVEDEVQIGDEVTVTVTEIDRMGRINLSRRALLQEAGVARPPGEGREPPYPPRRPPEPRPGRFAPPLGRPDSRPEGRRYGSSESRTPPPQRHPGDRRWSPEDRGRGGHT
ncbi:MAG: polyribonucleotide nucleotidyltransferase [Chloroflexi bacterium]|nr:polyribonucleotide nucleotidyltransferase [Chloroflexota bacterium]